VQVGNAATPTSAQLSLLTDGAVTINHNISVNNFGGSIFLGGTGAYSSTINSAISLAKNVSLTSAAGGTVHFGGNISGIGGITVGGAGTVNLSGANTYLGTTNVSFGSTANISAAGALPSGSTIVNNGNLDINGNSVAGNISGAGTLSIGAGSAASLKLAVGSGADFQHALSIAAGSSLDIANNQLFIDYGSGPDPIASIEQWIANGYFGASGPSIISSAIATDDAISGLSYGIGYADSADLGNPANLPSGTIEIAFTLLGDANLDGTVNAEDFTLFSEHLGQSGQMWDDGDFNYDGTVNTEDFTLFSHNLGQSASLAAQAGVLETNGFSLSNVPEPGAMLMVGMALAGAMGRRQRACCR
jgi:hypothetical protein